MTPLMLLWIGTLGAFFMHKALSRAYANKGASMEAIAAAASIICWAVFTLGAFDVQTWAGDGSASDVATGGLFYVGLASIAVMIVFLFQAATGALRDVDSLDITEVTK